jgi:hypothetical protein
MSATHPCRPGKCLRQVRERERRDQCQIGSAAPQGDAKDQRLRHSIKRGAERNRGAAARRVGFGSCGLHCPQRLRSVAVTRAAFAMLNVAAPATIPPTVDAAPASMSASDATSTEAIESSPPAPSDMMAAMARCPRFVISPSIAPTSTPEVAAAPQQKARCYTDGYAIARLSSYAAIARAIWLVACCPRARNEPDPPSPQARWSHTDVTARH